MTPSFDDWAEADARPSVRTGDLEDGEEITVELDGQPDLKTSDKYSGHFATYPCVLVDVPREFEDEDMDGETVVVGEGDAVDLMSGSKRLARAMRGYAEEHGWYGAVTISKDGEGMATTYEVEPVEGDEG